MGGRVQIPISGLVRPGQSGSICRFEQRSDDPERKDTEDTRKRSQSTQFQRSPSTTSLARRTEPSDLSDYELRQSDGRSFEFSQQGSQTRALPVERVGKKTPFHL